MYEVMQMNSCPMRNDLELNVREFLTGQQLREFIYFTIKR